jgi:hypothetical protein
MEELFNTLKINYKKVKLNDDITCYLTNANKDKIIMCVEVKSIEELTTINNFIPQNSKKIAEILDHDRDKEIVDNKIPISRFLWDMYLVGFHKISETGHFDPIKVSDIQRDRFVARKIIIEYTTDEELLEGFRKTIFPHTELDMCLKKIEKVNNEMISEIIEGVNINEKQHIESVDIFDFLDEISKALEKGD